MNGRSWTRPGKRGARQRAALSAAMGMALALATLWGCSATKTAKNDEVADSTKVAERQQLENEVTARMQATQARLDSLREDASHFGTKLNATLAARVAEAEAERDSAEKRIEALKQASADEWSEMRTRVAVMLDSLDVRIDRLRRDLHHS